MDRQRALLSLRRKRSCSIRKSRVWSLKYRRLTLLLPSSSNLQSSFKFNTNPLQISSRSSSSKHASNLLPLKNLQMVKISSCLPSPKETAAKKHWCLIWTRPSCTLHLNQSTILTLYSLSTLMAKSNTSMCWSALTAKSSFSACPRSTK